MESRITPEGNAEQRFPDYLWIEMVADDEAWLTARAVRAMGRWIPFDVPDDAEVRLTDACTAHGIRHHRIEVRSATRPLAEEA